MGPLLTCPPPAGAQQGVRIQIWAGQPCTGGSSLPSGPDPSPGPRTAHSSRAGVTEGRACVPGSEGHLRPTRPSALTEPQGAGLLFLVSSVGAPVGRWGKALRSGGDWSPGEAKGSEDGGDWGLLEHGAGTSRDTSSTYSCAEASKGPQACRLWTRFPQDVGVGGEDLGVP